MPFRAVVFGLIGALVPFSPSAYNTVVAEMARALTASPFEFAQVWAGIMAKRETSMEGTAEDDLDYALQTLNAFTHLDQRRAAIDLFYDFERRLLVPSRGTVKVLMELRSRGLKTALISNTVPIVARFWPQSEVAPLIDVAVFSCEAGVRKPDARIYHLTATGLGIEPGECLFVGNGSAGELGGAQEAGMTAVQILRDHMSEGDFAARGIEPWKGRRIKRLEDVIEMAMV
jgi:putative hydrolase of the HAD superfamily